MDGALDDSGADEKSYESVEAEDEPTSVSEAQELIQPQNDLAGSGTEADPFLVGSVEDLELLRGIMNGNPGVHVKMTSDISVGEWEPFYPSSGYITEAFSGVFDGCGHSITNLSVNRTTTNVGFFGGINGATIKNLHVSGTVSSTKAYVGGIVGKVQQGSLTGCSFSGSVSTGAKGSTAYAAVWLATLATVPRRPPRSRTAPTPVPCQAALRAASSGTRSTPLSRAPTTLVP